MSVGRFGDERDGRADEETTDRFAAELESDEEILLSWDATGVHWANQWQTTPDQTTFVATDRRIIFADRDSTTSIGLEHVRAVKTDPAAADPDLSLAFVVCGVVCLLVGLVVAASDFENGAGLVLLSVALLVAGGAVNAIDTATITIIIDNERQRLSFSAEESVGAELAELADRCDSGTGNFGVGNS